MLLLPHPAIMSDLVVLNALDLILMGAFGASICIAFSMFLFATLHRHVNQRFRFLVDANAEHRGDNYQTRLSNNIVLQNNRCTAKRIDAMSKQNQDLIAAVDRYFGLSKQLFTYAQQLGSEAATEREIAQKVQSHILAVRNHVLGLHRRVAVICAKISDNVDVVVDAADRVDSTGRDVWTAHNAVLSVHRQANQLLVTMDKATEASDRMAAMTQELLDRTDELNKAQEKESFPPLPDDGDEDAVIVFEDEDDVAAAAAIEAEVTTAVDVEDEPQAEAAAVVSQELHAAAATPLPPPPTTKSSVCVVTRGSGWASPDDQK